MTIGNYDFQIRLVAILFSDKNFVGGIYDVMNAKYFDNQELRQIIRFIINFYKKYLTLPTNIVYADWLGEMDEEEQTLVSEKIGEILSIIEDKKDDDFEYIKDKTIEFIEKQEVLKSVEKLLGNLDSGDYNFDIFRQEIAQTGGIGKFDDIGSEYVETFERRYLENVRKPIPTFSDVLNKYFDGGLGAGEVGFIQAPTNVGKSFLLSYMATKGIRLGHNVLYISLEMEVDYIGLRVDAEMCDVDLGEQRENLELIRNEILQYKGKFYLKRMSEESTNANSIRAYLKKLEIREKFKPDMVVIDYADLMIPNSKKESDWQSLSQTFIEIRAIAHDYEIPIWTAGQVNGDGFSSDFIDNNNAAKSKGKIGHLDIVFSLQRSSDDVENNVAKVFISKNRHGDSKVKLLADMNLKKNIMKIHEYNSEDGERIKKLMKENDGISISNVVKKYKKQMKSAKKGG